MRSLLSTFFTTAAIGAAFVATPARAFDEQAVQREVDAMNESLPTMVSPVLREEPVKFTGTALLYTFTHVNRSADDIAKQNLGAHARSYLLGQLCNDTDTRQMMKDGLVFSFVYVDAVNVHTEGAVVTERDCATRSTR